MESAAGSFQDLEELQFCNTQGFDKAGRRILRIVGKHLPAPVVDNLRLKDFINHKVIKEIPSDEQFCIIYFHTKVSRKDNNPGVINLRSFYETLPMDVRQRLQVVYFVHPGLLARTLLGILGRFFLSDGYDLNLHLTFKWV
ncbi:hypothetical protein L7F22_060035 [Adiantum nelumboides]|nr:hypothetical protein [Adiantum nelumboides]